MIEEADQKIARCVAGLIGIDSFWGYLFSHIKRTKSDFDYMMGVGLNERGSIELFFNSDMVMSASDRTLQLVLEHEGWHILDKHIIRRAKILEEFGVSIKDMNAVADEECKVIDVVNKKLFVKFLCNLHNAAADISVNYTISAPDILPDIKTKDGHEYTLIHAHNQDPPLEDGKSTEFYFIELYKRNKDKQEAINVGDLLGDHGGWELGDSENQSLVTSRLEAQIKKLVYDSYKHTRNRGNLPGKLKDMINEILSPPKIPYYQIIKKLVRASRLIKIQRSPTKLNKKRAYAFQMHKNGKLDFLPYPGHVKDTTFSIVVGTDTSGSMSLERCFEGLSACKNLIESDPSCKTTVLQCDTEILCEYVIKKLSDIKKEINGRGGTTLYPMLKRAKELDADVTLIFTDAECEDFTKIPKSEMPKKIIWVIPADANDRTIQGTGYIVRVNM